VVSFGLVERKSELIARGGLKCHRYRCFRLGLKARKGDWVTRQTICSVKKHDQPTAVSFQYSVLMRLELVV